MPAYSLYYHFMHCCVHALAFLVCHMMAYLYQSFSYKKKNSLCICVCCCAAQCAVTSCFAGHVCVDDGMGNAYCEPSCDPELHLCGEGERCELIEQDCHGRPCPHNYRCTKG